MTTKALEPVTRLARPRPSHLWWPGAVLALALVAFFPTYFGFFPEFAGTSASVHFHVATMLTWIMFTIAQPILIRRKRVELHRRLGQLTYAWLPVLAAGFWLVMRDGQLRRKQPDLILATAFDASLFFFLVAMGLFYRKRRAYHSRFMMLSLVPFLNPTLGRIIHPAVSVPIELIVLVSLWVRARKKQEDARPYAIAVVALLVGLLALVGVMVGVPSASEFLWRVLAR
ncbi:MAG: hypothetical protein SFV15_21535 [Polyangiaceae bacterium]|nr:hypothetical protein [Polyangiaceae bacterium]